MAAPNSTFNQSLSTTIYKYLTDGSFVDNIFSAMKYMGVIKKMGGTADIDGGDSMAVPLEYATNPTVGSASPWDEIDIRETDEFTSAQYQWKQTQGAIAVSKMDLARNSGESKIIDLVKAKLRNLERSVQQNMNTQLFTGDATVTTNTHGLDQLIAATGTVGGISSTAQTWWRSSVNGTSEALSESIMEGAYLSGSVNIEPPELILTTQTLYQKYMDLTRAKMQVNIPDARMAELGFDGATFKGKPIVYDADCQSGNMYFLNFKYLKLYSHRDFKFEVSTPMEMPKQHVIAYKILWIGNYCVNNRRFHARLLNKTT